MEYSQGGTRAASRRTYGGSLITGTQTSHRKSTDRGKMVGRRGIGRYRNHNEFVYAANCSAEIKPRRRRRRHRRRRWRIIETRANQLRPRDLLITQVPWNATRWLKANPPTSEMIIKFRRLWRSGIIRCDAAKENIKFFRDVRSPVRPRRTFW